jgi:hypothetical protein
VVQERLPFRRAIGKDTGSEDGKDDGGEAGADGRGQRV